MPSAITGADGSFEIRSTGSGRFVLLTSARYVHPGHQPGLLRRPHRRRSPEHHARSRHGHHGGHGHGYRHSDTDPADQLGGDAHPAGRSATRVGVVDELRQSPGVAVVQTGQYGRRDSLFVRGGNSTANKVLIDGITADDVGGTFDFGTSPRPASLGSRLYRGPNSALYGTDAGASVVNFDTPRGRSTPARAELLGRRGQLPHLPQRGRAQRHAQPARLLRRFSPLRHLERSAAGRYHSATRSANIGYNITANTQSRFTIRNAVSATGLPSAHDFYGISADGKQGDQDLYSGATLENRLEGTGTTSCATASLASASRRSSSPTSARRSPTTSAAVLRRCFTEYFGNAVTIRGANGYTATGQASFFIPNEDQSPIATSSTTSPTTPFRIAHRALRLPL